MNAQEKTRRVIASSLALFFLVLALNSCRTPAGRTSGEVVDDTTITTKVKAQLYEESVLRGMAISVSTFEGNVTLTGAVATNEQKERAETIAKNVYGVKKVNNHLMIKDQ